MESTKKQNISIKLAGLDAIRLQINAADEEHYRKAEKWVNELWQKWSARFGTQCSSEDIMARVAFQFARLYGEAAQANAEVEAKLSELEKQLDELVVKL